MPIPGHHPKYRGSHIVAKSSFESGPTSYPISCSMGIMAHNEEANIGRLLEAVLSQRLITVALAEIIVVASGCTDATQDIVRRWGKRDPRIRLVVQERREGKVSAINRFLSEAREKIVLTSSADLLPEIDAIEQLVSPLADSAVSMTTCRPVPINNPRHFMGFAAQLLWSLHHQLNLTDFKAGEMVSFRRTFQRIPYRTPVDEASIESMIRGRGYGVRYVGSAVIYNKGPGTVSDFLRQRRRIYAGHLAMRDMVGYRVATLSNAKMLRLVLRHLDWRPRAFIWTLAVVALEAYGRLLGRFDYARRRDHSVWKISATTKRLDEAPEQDDRRPNMGAR